MTWRSVAAAVLAACLIGLGNCPAAEDQPVQEPPASETAGASVQYLPLDAPAGMSQAVVVQGQPLVHTRQLLPLDREGKLVGEGSLDKQIEQVLNNLDAVLDGRGIGTWQTGAAERLRDRAADGRPGARAVEQAAGPCRPSGDHRGPDADAASQGAGGRRCGRGGGREGPGRGLETLRSRGRRQGLRRRCGDAARRCGVSVRRAERKRRCRVGRREVDVHPVEDPRTVAALAGPRGAAEGVSQTGLVGRGGAARTEEVLSRPNDSAGGLRGMDCRAARRDRIDRAVAPDGQAGRDRAVLHAARREALAYLQPCGTGPQPAADLHFRPVRAAAGRGEEQAARPVCPIEDHSRPDGQRHAASGQGLVLRVRRGRE